MGAGGRTGAKPHLPTLGQGPPTPHPAHPGRASPEQRVLPGSAEPPADLVSTHPSPGILFKTRISTKVAPTSLKYVFPHSQVMPKAHYIPFWGCSEPCWGQEGLVRAANDALELAGCSWPRDALEPPDRRPQRSGFDEGAFGRPCLPSPAGAL